MESEPLERRQADIYTPPWIEPARRISLGLFLIALAVAIPALSMRPTASWPTASLLIAAVFTTVMSLLRTLPLHNVVVAVGLTGLIGALAEVGQRYLGLGVIVHEHSWELLPPWRPAVVALIWIVALFSSRGSARFILRRGRNPGAHGLRVIGLTSGMVMLFVLGLEPAIGSPADAAWRLDQFIRSALWGGISIVALIVATPWLINKKPAPETPDWQPIVVWSALATCFAAAALARGAWLQPALLATAVLALVALAVRASTDNRRAE